MSINISATVCEEGYLENIMCEFQAGTTPDAVITLACCIIAQWLVELPEDRRYDVYAHILRTLDMMHKSDEWRPDIDTGAFSIGEVH